MVPCGEDLGVGISCVPETMKKHNILGLRVVRWCREWSEPDQPYVPFKNYEPLSVTTTSVHDSSTIREWWETEKESVEAIIKANPAAFGLKEDAEGPLFDKPENEISQGAKALAQQAFTPELAQTILKVSATSASQWFIPPLQDFLYMDKSIWLEKSSDERINIPGTVTKFNWTYRMPCAMEELAKDNGLIQTIKEIAGRK